MGGGVGEDEEESSCGEERLGGGGKEEGVGLITSECRWLHCLEKAQLALLPECCLYVYN